MGQMSSQAALSMVASAGEDMVSRRKRSLDAAGDLLTMGAALCPLVAIAVVLLFSPRVPVLAGVLFVLAVMTVLIFTGVLAWTSSAWTVTGTEVLMIGMRRLGGIGELPASMGLRYPNNPFGNAAEQFINDAELSETEMNTFRTLRAEEFKGSLRELVVTCRCLNR